jgi:hypothetical protein
MEHNLNPQFSKAHLTISNLNNFKAVEVLGLKIIAHRFPWMALPPYQISWKYTCVRSGMQEDVATLQFILEQFK